jgi:hypothetical protein
MSKLFNGKVSNSPFLIRHFIRVAPEGGLIRGVPPCHYAAKGKGMLMNSEAGRRLAAIVLVLLVAGCSSAASTVCQCPKPVAYDDATIRKITDALRALPPGNVLQAAMDDYEDERDALRICLAGGR